MTKESPILTEIEECLAHHRIFVIPKKSKKKMYPIHGFSIWNTIDPERYIGVAWRSNTGALRDVTGRLVFFGVPGLPDFQGWLFANGRRLSIEVKAEDGKMTADQAAHLRLSLKTGVCACVVRSYTELQDYLVSLGISRKATL